MLRDIRSHQRGVRLIEVEFDQSEAVGKTSSTDGIVRGFEHVKATDLGGDEYRFDLVNPGVRKCMGWAFPKAAGQAAHISAEPTVNSITFDGLGADFYVYILVFDSPDET